MSRRSPRTVVDIDDSETIKMIRRCAENQPFNRDFGEAARMGESCYAWTTFGVAHEGGVEIEQARTVIPEVNKTSLYPAFKWYSLVPAPHTLPDYVPEPVYARPFMEFIAEAPGVRAGADLLRANQILEDYIRSMQVPRVFEAIDWSQIESRIIGDNFSMPIIHRPREHRFQFAVSRQDLMMVRYPMSPEEMARMHARNLPPDVRPPDNATFRIVNMEESPDMMVTRCTAVWTAP